MFFSDRQLKYTIDDILKFDVAAVNDMLAPSNTLLQGATLRTATAYGRTATVKPGEDIRPALNSLKSAGGGTLILLAGVHQPTYDIVGFSGLNIVGEGVGKTIINFNGGNYNLYFIGTTSETLSHFSIRDLTIEDSHDTIAACRVEYADFWTITNVKVSNANQVGILVTGCRNFTLLNVQADSCGAEGFSFYSTSATNRDMYQFSVINCTAQNNTLQGFIVDGAASAGDLITEYSFIGCVADSNTSSGFKISVAGIDAANALFSQCVSNNNGDAGYDFESDYISIVGCIARSNTNEGFYLYGEIYIVGCQAINNGTQDIEFVDTVDSYTAVGNQITTGASVVPADKLGSLNTFSPVVGTLGGSTTTEKEVRQMKNTSGSALAAGDVVVIKAAADGDEVTTTTTAGDDYVFGMAMRAISNNEYGPVLVEGYTTQLKVDGTTDIAIGDFLCTFTSAGIAAKATTGDMAFAIALEAYTTDDSSGVLNALLISPRKL